MAVTAQHGDHTIDPRQEGNEQEKRSLPPTHEAGQLRTLHAHRCRPRPHQHTTTPAGMDGMWDPTYPRSATAIFLLAFPALKSRAPFFLLVPSRSPAPLHSINPEFLTRSTSCSPTATVPSPPPPNPIQSNGDDAGAAVAQRGRRRRRRGGVGAARGQGLLGRAAPQVRRPGRRRRLLQAAINPAPPQPRAAPQALVPARGVGALRQGLRHGVRGGAGAGRAQAPAQHRRVHRLEGRAAAAHHHGLLLLRRRAEGQRRPRAREAGRAARRGRRRALPRRAGADVEEDGGGRVEDVRGEAPEQPRAAHQRHGLADETTQAADRWSSSAQG